MQKKFLTNLGLLLLLNLLVKPLWILGIDREVQNVVGAESFGFYFALFNFSILFNILLDFGITTYNNRTIAQNPDQIQDQLSSIIGLRFILATVYAIVVLTIGLSIGYDESQIKMLGLLCLNQFLAAFILYFRSNLSGLHLFKSDAIMSILDRLLMIGICAYLLWGGARNLAFDIWDFVYAQSAAYGITLLIGISLVMRASGKFSVSLSISGWQRLLKETMPFAVMVLLMSIYTRIDAVMLERLLPDGSFHSGVYAQGYRLLDAAVMFAMLIAVLLLPIFSRMLSNRDSVEGITRLAYGLTIAPALILSISVATYNEEILDLLYRESHFQAPAVLSTLIVSFVPIATTYVFGTLLTANGNLKQINWMAFGGIIVNISLNLLLIPTMEAEGAAVASLSTQFFVAIIQVFLIQYIFKFKVNYAFIISIFILAGSVMVFGYFSKNMSDNWVLNFVALLSSGVLAAFLLKLISLRSVIGILKGGNNT